MRKIEQIIALNDVYQIHNLLTARKQGFKTSIEEMRQQWEPSLHKIFDERYRQKKTVNVPSGKTDPITGKPIYKTKRVDVVRIHTGKYTAALK